MKAFSVLIFLSLISCSIDAGREPLVNPTGSIDFSTVTSEQLYFEHKGEFLEGQVTLPSNLSDNLVVLGPAVDKWINSLSDDKKDSCLTSRFLGPNGVRWLVIAGVVIPLTSPGPKGEVYGLRLKLGDNLFSQAVCSGVAESITQEPIDYGLTTFCSTCNGFYDSTTIKLYSDRGDPIDDLNFSEVQLQIQMVSN